MAHPSVLRRLRAQREEEALRALRVMHPEESELLDRAQHDATSGPEFVDAAMTIELIGVVQDLRERVEKLEKSAKKSTRSSSKRSSSSEAR